jgi:hypothetical protein
VNQRAIDLSVMARGQLAWIGPGVHSLTTSELLSWMTIAAREARALRDLDPGRRLIRVNDLERSCPTVAGRCCIPGPQFERAKSLSPRSASHRRAYGGTVHV